MRPVHQTAAAGDGVENIQSTTDNQRESFTISLASIPDGSTITSVDVQVTYRDAAGGGDSGTFQTFTRLERHKS